MYLIKAFFLLLLSINLLANHQLKSNYFIPNDYVLLSDIVKNPQNDQKLYDINKIRHTTRVKAKNLLQKLQKLGYKKFTSKHNYIQFSQKSPINMDKIELYIRKQYQKKYRHILIENVETYPRSFLRTLPKHYSIVLNKKAYLKREGVVYIKTLDHRKIFFDYSLKATVTVLKSRDEIKRGDELSKLNSKKESIILNKFRAMPLQEVQKSTLQAKTKIKKDKVLTKRDVIGLNLVHRGSNINVSIIDQNMDVSFTAKAHQNGRYGQTITVISNSGKKLKVLVTGRNRGEIR